MRRVEFGARAAALLLLVSALGLGLGTPRRAAALDLGPSSGLSLQLRPSFPLFGGGRVVNIFDNDKALTNAAAHVGWSLAIPLLGERLGGRRGMWIAGLSWIALTVTQESLFHAPAKPGPNYPAEFRSDLLTRIVPCAAILIWDLVRHRREEF